MEPMLERLSLRQLLTLPYVVLILFASLLLGGLSYYAARDTVDSLSDQLLTETVSRIAQAVDKHVSGSEAVLETAFPNGMLGPARIADDLEALRTRFWLATSIHRDLNNYAYYGDRDGHFIGLWRHSESEGELRLRTDPGGPRQIQRFTGINGALGDPTREAAIFEPRARPWYKAGEESTRQTWTSIYIDFKTLELVATRARRVPDAAGGLRGVVATDLSLRRLNEFLTTLPLSRNGLAFIVERDGNLIATSRGPHLRAGPGGTNERLNAASAGDRMIAATYARVRALMTEGGDAAARTGSFDTPEDQTVQVGYARVRDAAGLDWIIAVAVPRSDFLTGVTEHLRRTTWIALVLAGLIALIGFGVLNVLSRDLRRLANAARRIGEGEFDAPLAVDRRDEIGDLAKSFQNMQIRLHTDRLTGLANREAIFRRIDERIHRYRRRGDERPFAVLFVDLNNFKQINDTFGHDMGDRVLRELGQRMRSSLRADDQVARFAGDEFVILLESVADRRDAEAARAHLEAALALPLHVGDAQSGNAAPVAAGAAIGVAVYPGDGQDVESLVKSADGDMYTRKAARPS